MNRLSCSRAAHTKTVLVREGCVSARLGGRVN
jgi:hypothetical protein